MRNCHLLVQDSLSSCSYGLIADREESARRYEKWSACGESITILKRRRVWLQLPNGQWKVSIRPTKNRFSISTWFLFCFLRIRSLRLHFWIIIAVCLSTFNYT